MPKIEVIVDGVDVTPKRLLSDEMIALAAKNLGDPNMSNTFMGELSLQSFGTKLHDTIIYNIGAENRGAMRATSPLLFQTAARYRSSSIESPYN